MKKTIFSAVVLAIVFAAGFAVNGWTGEKSSSAEAAEKRADTQELSVGEELPEFIQNAPETCQFYKVYNERNGTILFYPEPEDKSDSEADVTLFCRRYYEDGPFYIMDTFEHTNPAGASELEEDEEEADGEMYTGWIDTSTENGQTYWYKVIHVYKDQTFQASGEKEYCYLSRPSVSKVSSQSAESVSVRWEKNQAAYGYEVEISQSDFMSDPLTQTIEDADQNTMTFRGLESGNTYYVRVRSYRTLPSEGKVYSAYSKIRTVTVK
ncbi:MAG: fibronectin type III domain-containing protein [Butyricicoccus sp.]